MLKKLTVLVALLTAMSALAACGNDEADQNEKTHTALNGDKFNDADVSFATDMIPHHAQATEMVNLTMGRHLDPEVEKLAEGIRSAQVPEIETMVGWLTDWGKRIPATAQDHAHGDSDSGMEMHTDMPGMMTEEQMSELEHAHGADFQTMWLEMMIEHHQGAIEMAKTEIDDGKDAAAVDLAKSIVTAQTAEIDRIEKLIG